MANLFSYGSDVLFEYLLKTQNAAVQDTNSSAQQDSMILYVFEQLSNQVTNYNKVNKDNLIANKFLSAELERYKERVKLLKERQNVNLSIREKLIMDDIIREKNAQFVDFEKEINYLKQTLSEKSKEKELLTKTFNVFKNESKEKEAKNIDKEIALEKKVKKLDNIIRPKLYDGSVIAKETNVISIADSEETLMLEEESRSKMLLKQSKRFVPQQKMSDEQAFRLQTSHPNTDQSASSHVKIEAPRELPKKQFLIENDQLLDQIISQDILNIVVNSSLDINTSVKVNSSVAMIDSVNYVEMCNKYLELKDELIKQHNMVEKDDIKNDLRKLKGKNIVDNVTQVSNATTSAPGMYKLDPVILDPKVKNNKEVHEYYHKHTMEQAAILRELIQELLGYVRDTYPDIHKPSEKLVAVTSINKKKTVRFADTITSSGNIPKVTNRPLLSSTRVNPSTSASGLKPSGNTKNDRIPNSDSKNICNEHVKHLVKGAKALCSVCNECLFDANHAICLIDHVNSMNVRAKFAYKKKKWKSTGKVFESVGYKWKPTGRTFALVENACPLTRLTATNKVPLRVPIPLEVVAPEHAVTRVYNRRPKLPKSVSNSKPKVAKSMTANRMEPGTSRGSDTSIAPSSSSLIDCRLTATNKVPLRVPIPLEVVAPEHVVTRVYNRRPKLPKSVSNSKPKSEQNIRTDNGTGFVNQTLRSYYESVGISHETSVAQSPQQNGVVARRNRTLVEAARTMLIYAQDPSFL
ncbi:retrovirus-related pol polyprotein from transposon TNT 1-94 [Tanacetum coccineum]